MSLSIDPRKTRAVLVGASRFSPGPKSLPELPAVVANLEELRRLLIDPHVLGIPPENITVLLDEPNPIDVAPIVADEARKAEDAFIFYYSGHGLIGDATRGLYLATRNTKQEHAEFGAAIGFDLIRNAVGRSTASKRIVILDCCYSGRALEGTMGSESDVQKNHLDLEGTVSIAAAPANKVAISPEGEKYTAFTGELLKALREGLDNGKEEITMQEIFNYVRGALYRRGLPEPQIVARQDGSMLAVALNQKPEDRRHGQQVEDTSPQTSEAKSEVDPILRTRIGAS